MTKTTEECIKTNYNKNLHAAKRVKNDEFYTQINDISRELYNYKEKFKDKIVFCNCDDPIESNFIRYFALNFKYLGLKKLISTHYEIDKPSYKLEITKEISDIEELKQLEKIPLEQNGDFRSPECIDILKEADIVCTNPPFSLFREYVAQLMEYEKDFLIIGSMNAITYKETFALIKDGLLWLGNNNVKEFMQPDGTIKKFGNILWYTNLSHNKRNEKLLLTKHYTNNEDEYPKYDKYDIINVSKVVNIPKDYKNIMGVPITFLCKHNPEQFEILGIANSARWIGYECYTLLNGKKVYNRLLIKAL